MRRQSITLMAAAMLLVGSIVPAFAMAKTVHSNAGATANVTPSSGPSGRKVQITGSGFQPGEPVHVLWLAKVGIWTTLAADANGLVTTTQTIPYAVAGKYAIELAGETSDATAITYYTILNEVISLGPSSMRVGAVVNFLGTIPLIPFITTTQKDSLKIQYTYTPEMTTTAKTVTSTILTLAPNQYGGFAYNFTDPWVAANSVLFVFTEYTDTKSSTTVVETATLTFKPYKPTITLSPSTASLGTKIVVHGKGFAASEHVSFYLDVVTTTMLLNSGSADTFGNLKNCFFYAAGATGMTHTVIAVGANTGQLIGSQATALLTLTSAPPSGHQAERHAAVERRAIRVH